MDIAQFPQINPPQRLLMGPGPINADPRVLRAMSSQLIGQYDPAMTHYMNDVMALYRGVFRTENRWTMLVDGTSRAGIEAILVSAIRPGDKVLVPVFGRFGHLLCEIARRCLHRVSCSFFHCSFVFPAMLIPLYRLCISISRPSSDSRMGVRG